MEEHVNPLAVTHLLQHTLRSLCIPESSQWVYAVFWRILPRNYPPPKWDVQGGAYDRSRGNRRNWILVWEDGFCNFAASAAANHSEFDSSSCTGGPLVYSNCEFQHLKGLQPEVFFKMSHEIYNYGEGLIGKVAADHSHKWVFKEPQEHEINFLSAWHNPADSHPRTWEAQFQSGIKTIALIAVREGVVQLGAVNKVMEDLSYVVLLRKKFSYLENIPGVLLPHPSSSGFPFKIDSGNPPDSWSYHLGHPPPAEYYDQLSQQPMKITPSMSSLEALLSKLPAVGPAPSGSSSGYYEAPLFASSQRPLGLTGMDKVAKEEIDEECGHESDMDLAGESSSSMSSYHFNTKPNKGF
ncbi:protein RICE SALT SENSITIVE 3 isoform X2 [Magnolia sinica]|uniref:protein RICE SALT SENSITIVE 3 isoform X2 n=1 Tax=Magnolia sinica TaxID=86752 RepID=UPI00265AF690|nr:protein RICE SALT SENSITIVE 3 isoform X2 [Magnolia sinica]